MLRGKYFDTPGPATLAANDKSALRRMQKRSCVGQIENSKNGSLPVLTSRMLVFSGFDSFNYGLNGNSTARQILFVRIIISITAAA